MNKKYLAITLLCCLFGAQADAKEATAYRIIAGDQVLCGHFASYLNGYMSYTTTDDSSVVTFSGKPYSFSAIKLPNGKMSMAYQLDINNDGKDEIYFRYDGGGSYLLGSLLYVINHPETLPADLSNLQVSDLQVLPCQYDKTPYAASDCPTFSQNADEAGVAVNIADQSAFFRGRYTDIQTLSYQDGHYLLLRSFSQDSINYAGVIKPLADNHYQSVCLLKR